VTTLRIYKESMTALPQYKLRIYKESLTAAAPVITKLRIYKESLTAVAATVISVAATRLAGPGEPVQIVASLLSGGSATWTWRRISGPAFGLIAVGDTMSFTTPSLWNASQAQPTAGGPGNSVLVLGVKATVGGVESVESRCEVTILPQVSWYRNGGGSWVGGPVAPA
jgi:hypothetical protein